MSRTKRHVVGTVYRNFYPDVCQQLNQIIYVENIRNVLDSDAIFRQQGGTKHLQGLVFGTLRNNGSVKPMTAFNNK